MGGERQGCQLPGAPRGDCGTQSRERNGVLRFMYNAAGDGERSIEAQGKPVQQWLPSLMLAPRQLGGMLGAVTEQLGRAIGRQLIDNLLTTILDTVQGRDGQLRQRDRAWNDLVSLPLPLRRDCFGQALGRDCQGTAHWRRGRLIVKGDAETVFSLDESDGRLSAGARNCQIRRFPPFVHLLEPSGTTRY